MKKTILILVAVAVSSVGFLLGRTSANTSLAEGEQGQVPVNCSIVKTNGTLKGVTSTVSPHGESIYLVFEDSAGTIRIMTENCSVHRKYSRQ